MSVGHRATFVFVILVFGMAVCSAIECYVCTYKDGTDTLPDVTGVNWAGDSSASSTVRCKDGEAKHTLSETCSYSGDSCLKKVYTYGSTTYYERGCTRSCPASQTLLPASGLTLNQYCCGSSHCNSAKQSAPFYLSVLVLSAFPAAVLRIWWLRR